jgi:hypothetical protein
VTIVLGSLDPLVARSIRARPTSSTRVHPGDLGNAGHGDMGKTSPLKGFFAAIPSATTQTHLEDVPQSNTLNTVGRLHPITPSNSG